jgi:hypothetical protein
LSVEVVLEEIAGNLDRRLCETAGSGKKKAGNDIAHRGPYEPNRGKRIKIGSAIFESLAFPRTSSRRLEVSTFVGRDST